MQSKMYLLGTFVDQDDFGIDEGATLNAWYLEVGQG